MRPSGGAWRRSRELGIPEGVREAIERRLVALSPATRRIVTMAAAIGRSFSIELLEALAELPGERVLEALEEATARRIVEEEPDAPGRYSFAHALIRETLYASLSGPRRVALHRRIGAILEQRHAADHEPPLGELAYHFVEAAEPGTAAKAVDFSARAARRALAALAYEEAVATLRARAQGPGAVRVCRRRDPLRRAARPRRGPQQGERVRPEPRRLPGGRRSGADGRPRGAPRAARRSASRRGWIEQGTADPAIIAVLEEALAALPDSRHARSAQGCSAASRWSFTSPTSRIAARRSRGRAWRWPGGWVTRRRSRSHSTPTTGPSAARTKWASCSPSPTRSSVTQKRPRSSSWLSRAIAGVSLTSSSSGGRRDRRRDRCVRGHRRSAAPAVLSILGRRAAPHASAHAGPLRRRRAARQGCTGRGRGGGQLERDHRRRGSSSRGAGRTSGAAPSGPPKSSASCRTKCSPGRSLAARRRCGTATSRCSWPRPVSRRGRADTSIASPTATTPS